MILFTLSCIFSTANADTVSDPIVPSEISQYNETNEIFNENVSNTPWRIWRQIGPMPYEGQTKFVTFYYWDPNLKRRCYSGYLGAVNLTGGNWLYVGYVYRCDDTKPIPSRERV